MKRWFRFWAAYGFAHAVVKEEAYFFLDDQGNKRMHEEAREWAAGTINGQAIINTGYRTFKAGFRRVEQLPDEVREEKISRCQNGIRRYQEELTALRAMS